MRNLTPLSRQQKGSVAEFSKKMVQLSIGDFADATARMCEIGGVRHTRLSLRIRIKGIGPGSARVYLKSTDDRTTLTSCVRSQSELALLEKIVAEYISRCTHDAPPGLLEAHQIPAPSGKKAPTITPTNTAPVQPPSKSTKKKSAKKQ